MIKVHIFHIGNVRIDQALSTERKNMDTGLAKRSLVRVCDCTIDPDGLMIDANHDLVVKEQVIEL